MKKKLQLVAVGVALIFFIIVILIPYIHSGVLCSLDEAFENGWLTEENIKDIAYYYGKHVIGGGLKEESYIPTKETENLDLIDKTKIKFAYGKQYGIKTFLFLKIYDCYGTYNNCTVVYMNCRMYPDVLFIDKNFGSVTFYDYSPNLIYVWCH